MSPRFDNATRVLKAGAGTIARAGEHLCAGHLVAFPTETVYGLGADATNGRAVASIFEAKGRPHFNPLIVHVTDLAAAEQLATLTPAARRLAGAFWPGPLTLVLPRRAASGLSELVTAGLDTVAIRSPDHPVARALLAAAGRPLAAPSANRSGHVSPTLAAHVAADFPTGLAMILDGGPTAHGIESTVLDATGDTLTLLRSGATTAETIEAVTGERLARSTDNTDAPVSPGQLASHYAPRAALRLDAIDVRSGEAMLAFGPTVPSGAQAMINLSPAADLIEAAAHLFAALRALDATGVSRIAVMPIPAQGLGEAINDRLRRAAAPR
ncbi:MAG: L-threonylcarbamoyladenylate synthase [Hyphomicrobium sp.]